MSFVLIVMNIAFFEKRTLRSNVCIMFTNMQSLYLIVFMLLCDYHIDHIMTLYGHSQLL